LCNSTCLRGIRKKTKNKKERKNEHQRKGLRQQQTQERVWIIGLEGGIAGGEAKSEIKSTGREGKCPAGHWWSGKKAIVLSCKRLRRKERDVALAAQPRKLGKRFQHTSCAGG